MRNALLTLILLAILATIAAANPAGFFGGYVGARRLAASAEPWTPADLDGLALWLDASDASTLWADTNATTAATNNGLVARWDDKSGKGYHPTQATSGARPVRSGTRLYFDGVRAMTIPSSKGYFKFLHSAKGSYAIVVQAGTGSNPDARYDVWSTTGFAATSAAIGSGICYDDRSTLSRNDRLNAASGPFISSARPYINVSPDNVWTPNQNVLIAVVLDVANATATQRFRYAFAGGALTSDNAATGTIDTGDSELDFSLGQFGTTINYIGYMAEIVITGEQWSDADRRKLEGYLAHKWGLDGNLPGDHPYKSAAPTK